MSKIALNSNASGSGVFTIESPNSDTDRTLNLPDKAGTVQVGEGIDDNATSTAITISSAEDVGIGATPNNYSDYVTLTLDGTQGGAIDIEKDGTVQAELWTYRNSADVALAAAHASGSIRLMAGGFTERARVTSNGITFNGDTAAANALDDYEEGSFTPTYSPAANSFGSISYSVQSGYYVKLGNMVHFSARISLSGFSVGSAGSNYLLVSGWPYTAHNSAYSSVYVGYSYSFNTRWPTGGELGRGTNYSYLYAPNSTSDSSSVICSYVVGNGTHLYVSGSYYTF